MQKIRIIFSGKQGSSRNGPHCFLCAGPSRYSFLVEGNTNVYYSCDKCHSHFVGRERFKLKFLHTERRSA